MKREGEKLEPEGAQHHIKNLPRLVSFVVLGSRGTPTGWAWA